MPTCTSLKTPLNTSGLPSVARGRYRVVIDPGHGGPDPGAIGWALDRQVIQWVVPYHDGAVQYWREIGIWTDELEQHNNSLVERQEVLAGAWSEFIKEEIDDQQEFVEAWEKLRALRLEEAGFNPVWR